MQDNEEKKEKSKESQKESQEESNKLLEIGELKEKIDLCERERDEYLNGWRRAKADLVNFKREELQRLEEVVKYGNEEIIKDMIGVLESFDLALRTALDEKSRDGIERIRSQLWEILKRQGLEKIRVAPGEKFNPRFHEVLLQEELSKEPQQNKNNEKRPVILEELSCGYTLHGKVVKTAKVKISE